MSSIGASSAEIYVMRKKQKEKLKKMEEERVRAGDAGAKEKGVSQSAGGRSNKVHPGEQQGVNPSNV